jgi:hypothetical protein
MEYVILILLIWVFLPSRKKKPLLHQRKTKHIRYYKKSGTLDHGGTAIKDACRKVRNNGDLPRFRKLISELGSQMKDDQGTMLRIVGEEGIQILKEL